MAKQQPVLVSPNGKDEWTPEDAVQATNLKARGWTVKAEEEPAPKPAASKPATPKTDK